MGIVSPLGLGVEHNWSSLLESKSGLGHITHFPEPYNIDDFASKIAGVVPKTKDENPSNGEFNADLFVPPKDQRKMDPFIIYGMAAAEEAIADSGWKPETDEQRERTGVLVGAGIGGISTMYESARTLAERGPRRLSPFCIPCLLYTSPSPRDRTRSRMPSSA